MKNIYKYLYFKIVWVRNKYKTHVSTPNFDGLIHLKIKSLELDNKIQVTANTSSIMCFVYNDAWENFARPKS